MANPEQSAVFPRRVKTLVTASTDEEPGHVGHRTYTVIFGGSIERYIHRVRKGISVGGEQRLTVDFPTEDGQSVESTYFDISYRYGYPGHSRRLPILRPSHSMPYMQVQVDTYLLRLLQDTH